MSAAEREGADFVIERRCVMFTTHVLHWGVLKFESRLMPSAERVSNGRARCSFFANKST
jgi:hypothetical protein